MSDQASGRANSAKNKYSPASATADSLKEEAHTKALARQAELEAEKAMRELLGKSLLQRVMRLCGPSLHGSNASSG